MSEQRTNGGEAQDMSLRDYFAGQAMEGIVCTYWSEDGINKDCPSWAKVAYEMADAMLAARTAQPDPSPANADLLAELKYLQEYIRLGPLTIAPGSHIDGRINAAIVRAESR